MKLYRQLLRFSIVGAAGFLVDVAVLYGLKSLGLDLYSARIVSFVTAATSTWIGNRLFTFSRDEAVQGRLGTEWSAYLAAMSAGGLVNYLVYAVLLGVSPVFHTHPWIAVAAGTGAGLAINFVLARRVLSSPQQ